MDKYFEKEIRTNLYLESAMYDEEWERWKDNAFEVHKKAMESEDLSYCLESDLQNEEDYLLEEENIKLEIVKNYNGIVLYKKIKQEGK